MMPISALPVISLKCEKGSYEFEKSPNSFEAGVNNVEFDRFVETSCKIFECPIPIKVDRKLLHPPTGAKRYGSKNKRKRSVEPPTVVSPDSSLDISSQPEDNRLSITAVYDSQRELVEILMFKYPYEPIPRILMKVIALKAPFSQYLMKFTIKQCCIDMNTIHELNKILLISNITDVCLDHSPLKEANYDILLSESSSLRNLSLSRCNINDTVCGRIASRLYHFEPAELTLLVLNLSSNDITDVGLKCLAAALRTNRHLRYLNVSDNHIGDDGAKCIFEILTEFPLHIDEIQDKNRSYMDYLKNKEELYKKYMSNLVNTEKTRKKSFPSKGKLITRRNKQKYDTDDEIKLKAQFMAFESIGLFEHPFSPAMVTVKDGRSHCIGNLTLCYLNLRYNNLTNESVQRLENVVCHQKMYQNEKLCGLVNVLLEGNYVPNEAYEYNIINKDAIGASSKLSIKEPAKMIPIHKYMAQHNESV